MRGIRAVRRTDLGFSGHAGLACLVAAGLFPPSSAAAQESAPAATVVPADDSVVLRNGGLVRGRVLEVIPGDHVSVVLETGETRRIPWPDVDRAIIGSSSTTIPPLPAAAAPDVPVPTPPLPLQGPLVRVHLSSTKTAHLYRRVGTGDEWTQACESPCDAALPLDDEYRVTGFGTGPTKAFRLEGAPGGTIDLSVDPPSKGGMVGGGLLAGFGGVGLYVGTLLALAGGTSSSLCGLNAAGSATYSNCSTTSGSAAPGLITMGVSAAAMVLGLVVLINSAKTDIVQHDVASAPPQRAYLREPTWTLPAPSTASGAGLTVPFLSGSF